MKILFPFFLLTAVKAGKVLFYMPFVGESAKITILSIADELANRGHDVTVVMRGISNSNHHPGIRKIDNVPRGSVIEPEKKISEEVLVRGSNFATMNIVVGYMANASERALEHPEVKEMIKNEDTRFDAVISNSFYMNEIGYYLAKRFNASLVLYAAMQTSWSWVNNAMGQPHSTAFMPNPFTSYGTELSFKQRLTNTIATFAFEHLFRNRYLVGILETQLDQHLPPPDNIRSNRPSLLELERQASLTLHVGHPLLMDGFRPVVPNYVMIGMINCHPKNVKSLSPDLKKFLDEAEHGAIYVSFGSVLHASEMPEDKKSAFIEAFRNISQRVIWKWEAEGMADQPKNVLIAKWLPQQEILAHPNLKLFVTHGGMASFQETLCHKKPALFIPIQGDQFGNSNEGVRKGIGLSLTYDRVTADNIRESITEIIKDPRYSEAARNLGTELTDFINHPLDVAVWWIEYVMRHKGSSHFRSPGHHLYWYEEKLLDVYAFIIFVICVIAFISKKFYSLFWFYCNRDKKIKEN